MSSCSDTLSPEGEIVERQVEIPQGISQVEIGDGMTLVLSRDIPDGTAIIRTHENVQPHIDAKTKHDRIIFTVGVHRFKDLDVTVTVPLSQYHGFSASGGAKIFSNGSITLQEGFFSISGGSQATFAGTCTNAEIECSGGSVMHGYDLTVQSAAVNVSGGSRLELTVTQSLTGENSGGSHISYKGSPAILSVDNSGASQTIKQE